jgi:peptidoglycan/LPS O-acetylase OafA/YrhL
VKRAGEVVQAGEARSARIESLRAIAAVTVLVFHVRVFAPPGPPAERFAFTGQLGVFLFFALSGYLLFLPFAREAYGEGKPVELDRYARNRALRILPLYYATLAILLVVGHGGGSMREWVRFGSFTQSFFDDTVRNRVDVPMWSLAVEVQFYVLLPILAWLLARFAATTRRAAVAVAALGLFSIVVWERKVYGGGTGFDVAKWRYSLPVTFFEFTPGMLLALVQVKLERQRRVPRWIPPSDLLIGLGLGCWIAAAYWARGASLVAAVASFFLLGAVALPAREGVLVRALDWRALSIIGVASYSLYLWHFPVLEAIDKRVDLTYFELLGVGLLTCVGVALASYTVIERPFLRLRRRWGTTLARPDEAGRPGY